VLLHVLPNVLAPVIVQTTVSIADAILIKAGIANATDRHIYIAVLRRAIVEAAT